MKIALLGLDDQMLGVALAARQRGDEIIGVFGADPARVEQQLGSVVAVADWESLLQHRSVDLVLVSRIDNGELQAEQLRRLAQLQIPMLVSHPLNLSMLECFELEMIRSEVGGVILPNLPWRIAPLTAEMVTALQSPEQSRIGPVQQIAVQRTVPPASSNKLLDYFAQDADLLRCVCGDIKHVSAMGQLHGVEAKAATVSSGLGVQMSGASTPLIQWTTETASGPSTARVKLVGSDGRMILKIPESGRPWVLESESDGKVERIETQAETLHAGLVSAIQSSRPAGFSWTDAAKASELVDAVERSLKKGRTVEIQQQEFSESNTFKGTMAALGCGLLLAGLLLLALVAVVQSVARAAGWNWLTNILHRWPLLLLTVLVVFLLMQGLLRVALSGSPSRQDR